MLHLAFIPIQKQPVGEGYWVKYNSGGTYLREGSSSGQTLRPFKYRALLLAPIGVVNSGT
eukprot:352419-Amphidinium_carterae.2